MKTLTHVILPIGILVALVGVVAYVTQNTSRPPTTNTERPQDTKPAGSANGALIKFDDLLLSDDPKITLVEYLSHNHKDFWFHNPQTQPVMISTKFRSCKCSDLMLGTVGLSDAEWDALLNYPTLTGWCKLAQSVQFQPLPDKAKDRQSIPALPGRPYLLRLKWHANKPPNEAESEALRVEVWAEIPDGAVNYYERRVSFSVRPVVEFYPLKIDVGDILGGGSRTVDFFVWSETRNRMRIKPRVIALGEGFPEEPCAEVSAPVELAPKQLLEILTPIEKGFGLMSVQCAYRISVTLNERRGDKQLEMGPLDRRISLILDTDPDEAKADEVRIPVTGLVKGEVRLLNGDDQDRIKMGAYKYERGKKTVAVLGATAVNVELESDAKTTSPKLKAKLLDPEIVDGRKQWKLEVEMEPFAMLGELGSSTFITLRTKGPNSRLLRLPVSGRAER